MCIRLRIWHYFYTFYIFSIPLIGPLRKAGKKERRKMKVWTTATDLVQPGSNCLAASYSLPCITLVQLSPSSSWEAMSRYQYFRQFYFDLIFFYFSSVSIYFNLIHFLFFIFYFWSVHTKYNTHNCRLIPSIYHSSAASSDYNLHLSAFCFFHKPSFYYRPLFTNPLPLSYSPSSYSLFFWPFI